jgi:nucleotide-binding universal stress UspA family protein
LLQAGTLIAKVTGMERKNAGAILIAVDGSAHSDRAVKHAIRLFQDSHKALRLHLVNVQFPISYGEISVYVAGADVKRFAREAGMRLLSSARRLLERAGVPCTEHVAIGPVAETIVRYAKSRRCDAIIMGTRGLGSVAGLVLGSVATKVIHCTKLPVTLIK